MIYLMNKFNININDIKTGYSIILNIYILNQAY